ncbi:hypothetical protein D7V68_00175 [Acinetobacter cumulans]|nr:hypothetical protein D7V68_00175 [Acinetobacter cumulans]
MILYILFIFHPIAKLNEAIRTLNKKQSYHLNLGYFSIHPKIRPKKKTAKSGLFLSSKMIK